MLIDSSHTTPVTLAISDALLPSFKQTILYITPSADVTNASTFLTAVINPLVIGLYANTLINTDEDFDKYTKEIADNIGLIYKLSKDDLAISYLQIGQVIVYSISKTNLYDAASNTVDRTSQNGQKIYIEGTATHIIETPDFTYSTVSIPIFAKGLYSTTLDAVTNIPITSSETEIIQYETLEIPSSEAIGTVVLKSNVASAIRVLVTDPSYNLPIFQESSTIGSNNNTSLNFLYNIVVTNIGYSSISFSTKTGKVVTV